MGFCLPLALEMGLCLPLALWDSGITEVQPRFRDNPMNCAIRLLCAVCFLLIGASASAATPAPDYKTIPGVTPEPVTAGAGLKTPQELEAFLDGVMGAHLRAQHTAGVVVTVVKDGKLFFAKGYGYADVALELNDEEFVAMNTAIGAAVDYPSPRKKTRYTKLLSGR
jgi:hypothetical protein